MRRKEPELLGNLIDSYFEAMGLKPKLDEAKLMSGWNEVVGPLMSRHTSSLSIKDRVLYVKVDSSIVRNELMMMQADIVARLNGKTGASVIDKIIFR